MSISPSWSRRLAGVLLLELLVLAVAPGCGSLLTFTPERAAVEALLGSPEITGRQEVIVPGSVKVAQTLDWQDGAMVMITYGAADPETGPLDCLHLFQVKGERSRWVAISQGEDCMPTGGDGEPFLHLQSQSWGSDDPGMSIGYGLVYDEQIVALDILWEDGEREAVPVVNGIYLWPREGVHETVLVRPLDAHGDPVQ